MKDEHFAPMGPLPLSGNDDLYFYTSKIELDVIHNEQNNAQNVVVLYISALINIICQINKYKQFVNFVSSLFTLTTLCIFFLTHTKL